LEAELFEVIVYSNIESDPKFCISFAIFLCSRGRNETRAFLPRGIENSFFHSATVLTSLPSRVFGTRFLVVLATGLSPETLLAFSEVLEIFSSGLALCWGASNETM
jgi:hypothetical protein